MTEIFARAAFARGLDPLVIEARDPVAVTWHSFDLRTGRRGPEVTVREAVTLGRILGEPTDLSGLAVRCYDITREPDPAAAPTSAGTVLGWAAATLPGRTMLVALDGNEQPLWGGMVLRRTSGPSSWVDVDLVTLEAYFDRRYVTDHTYIATAQGAIVAGILTDDVIPTGVEFTVDASAPTVRDRTYFDDEDKTALSVLQELMGIEGGPEFTVDLEWADETRTVLARIVRVRNRLGQAPALPVQFLMPGPVVDFTYTEDYGSDNGANDVLATSSGEGDVRPESDHQVAQELLDAGWPRFEDRFSPSTSITDTTILDQHAAATLLEMKDGLNEIQVQVHLDSGPRVGEDFALGDNVSLSLTCPRFPAYLGPDGGMVPGYVKTVRCIGWEIDLEARRLTPRLVEAPSS